MCCGRRSQLGPFWPPRPSTPLATSLSFQPSIGMQRSWASQKVMALLLGCLLSWWEPTPLPPTSSLQVPLCFSSLTSADSSFVERKGNFEFGRKGAVFVGSLQSLGPELLAAQASSGLGIRLGWSQAPPLMPVCPPGGSRLPAAPALALPV